MLYRHRRRRHVSPISTPSIFHAGGQKWIDCRRGCLFFFRGTWVCARRQVLSYTHKPIISFPPIQLGFLGTRGDTHCSQSQQVLFSFFLFFRLAYCFLLPFRSLFGGRITDVAASLLLSQFFLRLADSLLRILLFSFSLFSETNRPSRRFAKGWRMRARSVKKNNVHRFSFPLFYFILPFVCQ